MIIESMGRKDLMFRGYIGMAASLGLLSVTVYFQVSLYNNKKIKKKIYLVYISSQFVPLCDMTPGKGIKYSLVLCRKLSGGCRTAAWFSFSSSFSSFPVDQVCLFCNAPLYLTHF